jgi:peptidase M15-like protein
MEYGSQRTATSGYRTPLHNSQISGVRGSRHMFGDALDLYNTSCTSYGSGTCPINSITRAEWDSMYVAANRANASFREVLNSAMGNCPCSGIKHVHADWRPEE